MPDLTPTTIDASLAEPLGRVVIGWASVEGWMSMLLAHVLDADQGGMQVLTNTVSTSTQTQWIRHLLKHRPHEAKANEKIVDLLNWADDLRSERNEFVHGLWDTTNSDPGTAMARRSISSVPKLLAHALSHQMISISL